MNQPTTPNTVEDFLPLPEPADRLLNKFSANQMRAYVLADRAYIAELEARTPAAPVVAEGLTTIVQNAYIGQTGEHLDAAIAEEIAKAVLAAHPVAPAVVAEGLTDAVLDNAAADAFDRTAKARNLSTIDVNPNVTENWTLRRELVAAGWRLSAQAHMAPPTNALRCKDCHDAWPDNDPNCQCITAAAHPVAGSPAEAVTLWRTKGSEPWLEARNEDADAMRKNPVFELRTLYTSPAAAAPMPASEAPTEYKPVGKFLYVGIGYEATSSDDPRGITLYRPTAAPVPASEAARVEAFEKMLAQDEVNRIADEAARRDRPAAFAAPAAPTDTKYNKE